MRPLYTKPLAVMRFFVAVVPFLFCMICASPAHAQVAWKLERGPSSVSFRVSHFYFTHIEGQFKSFRGTVVAPDEHSFANAEVNVVIPVSSVYTGIRERDNNLQDEPFFWADQHPEMRFSSTAFEQHSDSTYTLMGDLTIRGITHPITLDVAYRGLQTSTDGMTHAFFHATGTLNRYDYGMQWNTVAEAGGFVVGEEVEIELTVALAAKLTDLATSE